MSETALVRAILIALKVRGVWAWRNNAGTADGGRRRLAETGSPDILGICARHGEMRGVLFGLECKTESGKQSDSQRAWQDRANMHSVRYRVVRSVSEALAALEEWS